MLLLPVKTVNKNFPDTPCRYGMKDSEATTVPNEEIEVKEAWPGEWRASFRDWEGRWTQLSRPFRARKLALRAARIAWLDNHIP